MNLQQQPHPLQHQTLIVADKGIQCENDRAFVHALLVHIKSLETECASLRLELTCHKFSMERIAESDHDIAYYTGFSSYQMLLSLWNYLGDKVNYEEVKKLTFHHTLNFVLNLVGN